MKLMALSIRQPWAWLIVRPDLTDPDERATALAAGLFKDIENRDWKTNFRGKIAVHASKGMTRAEYDDANALAISQGVTLPAFDELERGGIVGTVEIVDCVDKDASPWFFGDYGFVLKNAQPLPFQFMRGKLGFFPVEVEVKP